MIEREKVEEKLNFIKDLLTKTEEPKIIIQKSRKEKNKEKILEILKNKKVVTLNDIAKELNISIQRASEYLNELFREQKITFYRQNRKKYFKLIKCQE